MKTAKNTQTQKASKIGLHFRKLKLRKVKGRAKEIYCPQGGKKNNQGENIKQRRRGREGRKQREPRGGGDRNRTSSGNNPLIQ